LAAGRFSGPESSYMSRDFFLDELYDNATAQEWRPAPIRFSNYHFP
jgi:hypothetical protein